LKYTILHLISLNQTTLETTELENEEVEKYLSDSLISYGIAQMNAEKPLKAYCSFKDKEGNIIGSIMGYKASNLFFITQLYVEKRYRNNGYGYKLLSAIENKAKSLGCNLLRLNTLNKKTMSLYTKAGFKKTNSITNYMDGFDLYYYHKNI